MTRNKVAATPMQLVVNALLVAVYTAVPFAVLAAGNRSEVAPGEIVLPYVIVAAPAVLIVLLVGLFRGSRAASRVGPPLAVGILFTFDYQEMHGLFASLAANLEAGMVVFWAIGLLTLVILVATLAQRSSLLAPLLLLAGIAMLGPPVVTYANYSINTAAKAGPSYGWTKKTRLVQRPAPDVFFFMLDAYSRPDRLKQQLDYSDGPFLKELRSDGFVVPRRSLTAYGFTALSVPSMLQMDYVAKGPEPANLTLARDTIAGHNRVVSAFKALGYSFVYAPSEYGDWGCRGFEDICVRPSASAPVKLGVSQFQWAMMERTPLADALRGLLPSSPSEALVNRRQFPSRVANAVLARKANRPVFAFAHVLLTHPIYLYHGRNCKYRHTTDNEGQAGRNAYLEAVRCVNVDTTRAIRTILARDRNAIIVLASDHGSDVDVDHGVPEWNWSRAIQRQRFANFAALRLPRRCRSSVPDDLIEVNIMRSVLDCITDAHLRFLKTRQFLVDQPTGAVRSARRNLSP